MIVCMRAILIEGEIRVRYGKVSIKILFNMDLLCSFKWIMNVWNSFT